MNIFYTMYHLVKRGFACLLTGSLLINTLPGITAAQQDLHTDLTQLNSKTQTNRIETPPSEELLILWDTSATPSEKKRLLAPYHDIISISQEYDNFMVLTAASIKDAKTVLSQLSNCDSIQAIDYNEELTLCSTNDEYSSTQWGLNNTGSYSKLIGHDLVSLYSIADVDMDIPEGWAAYTNQISSAKEVIVAVIDTGVDYMHPDLSDSMWINKGEIPDDGIDNDGNGYVDDIFGWDFYNDDNTICHYEMNDSTGEITADSTDKDNHGTHVAGIIAAQSNNKIGIAGVASNVNIKIMSLKIHGGSNGKGTVSEAILAIKYATEMGANICNMSWGSTTYNKALELAVSEAPMLFVTAAGNTGANNDKTPMYPANYDLPNVISVTYLNQYGTLTSKSNYGPLTVDVAAPGSDILSTVVQGYDTLNGSSMAAAHVSGLAAILYSISDYLSPANVKEIIMNSSKPLTDLKGNVASGGIPSLVNMINSLDILIIDNISPTIQFYTRYVKDIIEVELNTTDEGGSGLRIVSYLSGRQNASSFKHGLVGTTIYDNKVDLYKGGWYTFYASDYAGNETCTVFNVLDDSQAPEINADYQYTNDGNYIYVDVTVTDNQSGLKTVKYAKGVKTSSDFKSASAGVEVTLNNSKGSFRVSEPGEYTIYAVDYRGNKTVKVINIDAQEITKISIGETTRKMSVSDILKLNVTVTPADATEHIYYTSSDSDIVSVSQWGMLHAKAQGTVIITVTSTKGISKRIKVIVQ